MLMSFAYDFQNQRNTKSITNVHCFVIYYQNYLYLQNNNLLVFIYYMIFLLYHLVPKLTLLNLNSPLYIVVCNHKTKLGIQINLIA